MNRILVLVAALGLTLSACDSADPVVQQNLQVRTASNIFAPLSAQPPGPPQPPSGPYKLYSLRTNSVVANVDSASTAWDIGFRATDIIVNGGTSGPGMGQAVVVSVPFADLTAVPSGTAFRTDGTETCGTRPSRAICEGTAPANAFGFYTYTPFPSNQGGIILPTPGRTILIRTADGQGYAKVQVQSYYQNAPAEATIVETTPARYYSFRYVINPAGRDFAAVQ